MYILILVYMVPFAAVAYFSANNVVTALTLSDVGTSFVANLLTCSFIGQFRAKAFVQEREKEELSKRFLGPQVSRAVYDGQRHLLDKCVRPGFLVTCDMRGYTKFMKLVGSDEVFSAFTRHYQRIVKECARKHGGDFHKGAGDGHILSWGLFTAEVDLSGLPGLEDDERRAQHNLRSAMATSIEVCLSEIVERAQDWLFDTAIDVDFRLGASIHFGDIETHVSGSDEHLELEPHGKEIVTGARLQDCTKNFMNELKMTESILIVSPSAAHYLQSPHLYTKIFTANTLVKDCEEIAWFLLRGVSPRKRIMPGYEVGRRTSA